MIFKQIYKRDLCNFMQLWKNTFIYVNIQIYSIIIPVDEYYRLKFYNFFYVTFPECRSQIFPLYSVMQTQIYLWLNNDVYTYACIYGVDKYEVDKYFLRNDSGNKHDD